MTLMISMMMFPRPMMMISPTARHRRGSVRSVARGVFDTRSPPPTMRKMRRKKQQQLTSLVAKELRKSAAQWHCLRTLSRLQRRSSRCVHHSTGSWVPPRACRCSRHRGAILPHAGRHGWRMVQVLLLLLLLTVTCHPSRLSRRLHSRHLVTLQSAVLRHHGGVPLPRSLAHTHRDRCP